MDPARAGVAKRQRRETTPKAIRPRSSAPAKREPKIARGTGGQGALDELQVDLRTSEERWQSLLENPIFGVTFVGQHHRYEGTNRAFQSMVGYTAEELRQISPLDISVAGERELNALYFKELQSGERNHYEMIKQLRRKDGSLIWTHLYVFSVTDRKSGAKLPFGIVFDITDKKRAQDALEEARAELVRVARLNEMGAMTGSIAHEISQPLSSIVTAANAALRWIARSNPEIEETKALLRGIVHDGQRASEIIKGIRAMFRAAPEQRSVVNLNELIREVLVLLQVQLRNALIEVRTELDEIFRPYPPIGCSCSKCSSTSSRMLSTPWIRWSVGIEYCVSGPSIAGAGGCLFRSRIPASVSRRRTSTGCSRASSPPRPTGWGWVSQSANRSSNRMAGSSRRRRLIRMAPS